MDKDIQEMYEKHDKLIRKLRRRRNITIILLSVLAFATVIAGFPIHIDTLDGTIIDYEGLPIAVTIILLIFIYLFVFILSVINQIPINAALYNECDPKKHLALNLAINFASRLDHVKAMDYFYMGKFDASVKYADIMINSKNRNMVIAGYFNKARCEFFTEDFETLKETVKLYKNLVSTLKTKGKNRISAEKMLDSLDLMVAIADEDKEKLSGYRDVKPWTDSLINLGFVNYIKGRAAYILDDKEDAAYRFNFVKENCAKTILAEYSERYLSSQSIGTRTSLKGRRIL
ncbi:MAG: hypothetical protein IJZ75_04470 [Clostridia bacterium]|nr:hypothetical protein [Clostridia bacterium]